MGSLFWVRQQLQLEGYLHRVLLQTKFGTYTRGTLRVPGIPPTTQVVGFLPGGLVRQLG
jgi:hypothetical protein